MAIDYDEVVYRFEGTVDSLRDATNKAINLLDRYEKKVSNTSTFNPVAGLTKAFGAFVKLKIGSALGEAVKQSISLIENVNLFSVAMGKSVAEGTKFVNQMADLYGMDPNNLYRTAGYFYQLTDAIGMTDDASRSMSLSLTKASNDIASLFNVDIQTVVNNLSSGMQGLTRAVRKYGMDIRTSTLQQTAYTYGLTQNVQKMSESNRMALRYITMMNQANNAIKQNTRTVNGANVLMGDFARNIETPANQLRIFKEQVAQAGRALGNFFLPILAKILPILNGFIMALRTVLEFFGSLFNIKALDFSGAATSAEDEAEAIKGIGSAASGTAKKLKNLIAPFDELTILSQDSGSSGGGGAGGLDVGGLDPALAKAIEDMQLSLDDIRMKAHDVRDALLDFFGFDYVEVFNPDTGEFEKKLQWFADKFEANLINKFPQWEKTITALFDNWSGIIGGIRHIFQALRDVILELVNLIAGQLSDAFGGLTIDEIFANFINSLPEKLESIATWIEENKKQIAQVVEVVGGLWLLLQAASALGLASKLSGLLKVVSPVFAALKGIATVLMAMSSSALLVVAGITAVIAVLVTLWKKSDTFRATVTSAIDSLLDILSTFWEGTVKPILESIISLVQTVWDEIKPIIDNIINIIGAVIEILIMLLRIAFEPLVRFLVDVIGPSFAAVFEGIIDIIKFAVEEISRLVKAITDIIYGIVEFIAGVFTGDFTRAWNGVKKAFGGIINSILTIMESFINLLITGFNAFFSLIVNGIGNLLRGVLAKAQPILSKVGINISVPQTTKVDLIPRVRLNRVQFADGGIVTGPTNALIGEGRYDEAVIPLGNSPQMRDLTNTIAQKVGGEEQVRLLREQNELLRQILDKTGVNIDGRQLAEVVSKHQRGMSRAYGV